MKPKREYRAGIGIERMNQIMSLLLLHSMTIDQITEEIGICKRLTQSYLVKLLDMHKVTFTRPETGKQGGKPKIYRLAFGAMPIPAVEPKHPRTRPLKAVKEKTGPKPKAEPKKSQNVANPSVRVVKAEQVGMARDPFVALIFGSCAAQA